MPSNRRFRQHRKGLCVYQLVLKTQLLAFRPPVRRPKTVILPFPPRRGKGA